MVVATLPEQMQPHMLTAPRCSEMCAEQALSRLPVVSWAALQAPHVQELEVHSYAGANYWGGSCPSTSAWHPEAPHNQLLVTPPSSTC